MARFRLDHLFSNRDLREYLEIRRQKMSQAIEQYHPNKLLNTPMDDLVEYFADLGSVEAPKLIDSDIYVDQAETKVDVSHRIEYAGWDRDRPHYVPGTSISLHIPFTGEAELFQCRASTFNYNPPYAAISGNEVIIEYTAPRATPEEVKRHLDGELKKLQEHLSWVQRDVRSHNNAIRGHVHQAVEARRQRLLDNQNLVSSLGYPLKRRPDAPTTYVVPDVKRKTVSTPPPASTAPFAPEPGGHFRAADLSLIEASGGNPAQVNSGVARTLRALTAGLRLTIRCWSARSASQQRMKLTCVLVRKRTFRSQLIRSPVSTFVIQRV